MTVRLKRPTSGGTCIKTVSEFYIKDAILSVIVATAYAEFMYVDNEIEGLIIYAGVLAVILWFFELSISLKSEVRVVKEKEPWGQVVGGVLITDILNENVDGLPDDELDEQMLDTVMIALVELIVVSQYRLIGVFQVIKIFTTTEWQVGLDERMF